MSLLTSLTTMVPTFFSIGIIVFLHASEMRTSGTVCSLGTSQKVSAQSIDVGIETVENGGNVRF